MCSPMPDLPEHFPLIVECRLVAEGFCAASIDGYCIGGFQPFADIEPVCHG